MLRRAILIFGGLLLMLAAVGNGARPQNIDPQDTAGRIGASIGLLLLAVVGLFMFLRGIRRQRAQP